VETVQFLEAWRVYSADGRQIEAVKNVTASFSSGTFTAVVGRSGCGKSTLLNLAGAMDRPTRGEVRLLDRPTTALPDEELTRLRRRQVGFVFQFFNLLPTLTVFENVELPLLLDGQRDRAWRVREMLVQVDLWDRARDYPHQLSGGEMQRVAIARALVQEPAVLIADEPTGNLDSANAHTILKLLARAASEVQATVIMATHSREAAAFADRLLFMRDGRIERTRSQAPAAAGPRPKDGKPERGMTLDFGPPGVDPDFS
jgi:putative ABC transport system ATP-binding protein